MRKAELSSSSSHHHHSSHLSPGVMSGRTPEHLVRFRYLPGTAKIQGESLLLTSSYHTVNVQVLRNLHREVMELNSELNLLKKTVFLSERELEEYQFRTEDYEYEV